MSTKVARWGNSLALRIPRDIAERFRLYEGVRVAFRNTRSGALITAVKEKPTRRRFPTLKEALANFTSDMVEQVKWRSDVGKEVVR
ncbi:MAG TPA: AbrB/MazE/SpoVT family DNA-binding domain-containing protein [Candidatus Paceibacterota bacterium]